MLIGTFMVSVTIDSLGNGGNKTMNIVGLIFYIVALVIAFKISRRN